MGHFVCILRCADDTFYIGRTSDVGQRFERHCAGDGCRYTASRLPLELVYSEACASIAAALKREQQLKRWTTAKKEALIRGDREQLRRLSRRRRQSGEA